MRRISILLLIFTLSSISIDAQIINAILTRIESHQNALISLKAEIKIKESNPFLYWEKILNSEMCIETTETINLVETTYGKLNYLQNRLGRNFYLRIDSLNQSKEVFLIKNSKYLKYQPTQNEAVTGDFDVKNTHYIFALLDMSKGELRKKHRIRKLNNAILKNEEMFYLKLVPRNLKSYKYIYLWVDKYGMIRQIKTIENNGNLKSYLFSNLEKNYKDFDANVFNLKLPKDTKIIQ